MAGGTVTFQAQNPAISGDPSTYVDSKGRTKKVGWTNCTAFVAAMGAEFDNGLRITGTQIRAESSEPSPDPGSPGLNLTQVAAVLRNHGLRLDVETPIAFDDLDELRVAGHAIALQLGYGPIQHTVFSGDPKFSDGHIVLWLPSGDVFDPLDDGRRQGIARAPVQIPREILRQAAGSLALSRTRTVGLGRAYAGIFPTPHPGSGVVPPEPPPVTLQFGATTAGAGEYRVTVPVALVRSGPSGVPQKANVVGRRARGARVQVFGTSDLGQSVAGSRRWHQVDRAGTQFMHSSVIAPA